VQSLVQDISGCTELVSRSLREAEGIIRGRFEGMIADVI
jgi:tetrahydromethanopterin S-methyltransferase subunit F